MSNTPFTIWQPIRPDFDGHRPADELDAIPRRQVYAGTTFVPVDTGRGPREEAIAALERLFQQFNIAHPDDFRGHSLSVNDVVTLGETAWRCGWIGWERCPTPQAVAA